MRKRTPSLILFLIPALMAVPAPEPVLAGTDGVEIVSRQADDSPAGQSRRAPAETMSRRNGLTRTGRAPGSRTGPAGPVERLASLEVACCFMVEGRPLSGRDVPIAAGAWFSTVLRN